MQLIAFTGLKGSGKDTAASVFVERGFQHVKFADALKTMLRALLDYQGVPAPVVDAMIEGHPKESPNPFLGGLTPRWAMQSLGTEWGRQLMGEDFWVDITRQRCRLGADVVISDVRFPNEVAMVRQLRGATYRIRREPPLEASPHPSEAQIRDLLVDGDIVNSQASAEGFKDFIKFIFPAAEAA